MDFSLKFIISCIIAGNLFFNNSPCWAEGRSKADLVGHIIDITQANAVGRKTGRLYTMIVKDLDANGGDDRIVITVTYETQFFRLNGEITTSEHLKKGGKVKVWFRGPSPTVYPPTENAGVIQFLD